MKQKYQTFQFGDETSRQTSTMSLTLENETIEMILF